MDSQTLPVGALLRQWRQRRRLSQLDLACDADISTRHLSFVETGRALPSREMLLHLAEQLDIPLRERNRLLGAAGYAPVYSERALDDPALTVARQAIDQLLKAHEPNPAMVVDRHWNLLASNHAVSVFLIGVAPELLAAPCNVLRMSLHPRGLAPNILNLGPWKAHVMARLQRDIDTSGDPQLQALRDELALYPAPPHEEQASGDMVLIPVQLNTELGVLSLIGTITVFGTPVDVTLSELALETFFPADARSAEILRRLTGAG
ncbi:helix-turn-helix domain-containing protein [Pseudomonas citronellolis]|uniref:Transcriptional regulator n=1 Tax=Pseudomonas citronellolis TaxID=53408 RepID=A0A1A9KKU9_9PSED|nr:helix-turn-helix domain-containing protein [Pseudomonas citronellolis]ANI18071.1 transcriptional regulator [Pseudomonas citronellolis]KRV73514.1 XRE family transcriptional regulator [Pseudomonas citronellolis]KRW79412.1 XRE family transcriptional regulator [Pseudomonas citronellolis]MCP1644728.1 transcriptional regulator with XRE-family HTH domain [Pseudomonas citronellolis]MCP1665083.1 transcriptional regulator with XRE-family HTH domain [Pseudomonas citronellolis]